MLRYCANLKAIRRESRSLNRFVANKSHRVIVGSEQVSDVTLSAKIGLSLFCNVVEGHCLQAMKIVHHHANGCFDWLICGHQSINLSREAISILSGKFKRFTFLHSVIRVSITLSQT